MTLYGVRGSLLSCLTMPTHSTPIDASKLSVMRFPFVQALAQQHVIATNNVVLATILCGHENVAEHMVILVFFNEIWATAVGDEA